MTELDLEGRVALITGAGQGVGRAIALQMAACNAKGIVVNDVHRERAQAVVDEIEALGHQAVVALADVTDFGAVSRMVTDAEALFGSVDIVVNNAGSSGADPMRVVFGQFWEIAPETWEPFLGANLYGPMNVVRAVLPTMIQRNAGGRLITIVSDAGRVGEPGLEAYAAAKAGAAGFTRAIAKAVGRYGITANNVAIGATLTPTTESMHADPETSKRSLSRYVIRRVGLPEDIAPLVVLLASSSGSWITGQTYPVNGGYSFTL